ncbi:MFS transporter [Bordetella petrii]|uniref:MFS transporter n=1 Tax=Bordetella petrii TaxID=94624 RepID=UPI001E375B3A|nr:MFS transporter [Bordetella petrii]
METYSMPGAGVSVQKVARSDEVKVVVGASAGALLEWYDFFLYGALAVVFSPHFFPAESTMSAYLAALGTFGVGFVARPLGAIIFGRFGDKIGRKTTFLITIVMIGSATVGMGLLPTFASIGWWAPILLTLLRVMQGLALGGEYGGAAAYVAEYSEPKRRGLTTGFLQATAALAFLLSLAVVMLSKVFITPSDFADWGWRVPFLSSIVLLAVSGYIRNRLAESPVFQHMKAERRLSKSPLREALLNWENVRVMLIVLFGAQAAAAAIWYTCNFYVLYFLTTTLKIPAGEAYKIIATMLLFSLPLYVIAGWLSDKIGRKWVILTGCGLAVLTIMPLFAALAQAVNPALVSFQESTKIRLVAKNCRSAVFTPTNSDCDRARDFLLKNGLSYTLEQGDQGEGLKVHVGTRELTGFDPKVLLAALIDSGYPRQTELGQINRPRMYALLAILMLWGALAYGPMSALYVELFPARIRYTSINIPYNIGAAIFGGLAPFIATAISIKTGNVYAGLWYPIIVGGIAVVVAMFFMRETKDVDVSL